mmetsp:Transcript_12667/g.20285  ORF Transcript_12667/g.20285 Transcript_12667/m.20285 type:complete len:472 (-) Transcript_12667:170-1585(-)
MMFAITVALAFSATPILATSDPYSSSELDTIKGYFFKNVDVDGTGAVIAAPSDNHPDYSYHWMRDGAISINVAYTLLKNEQAMKDYLNWALTKTMTANDPNGVDIRGEPKFYMDGRAYDKPWGRPQNDGSALRAIAMINYANDLIKAGKMSQVKGVLYDSDGTKPGIKFDLEFIAHNWQDNCFDLWEEVNGDHFFTKMVQRKALAMGARLATALGDDGAATYYKQQVSAIEGPIKAHWDSQNGVIKATMAPHPGPQKYMELDSAIHLGVLYGYDDDGFYAPNDPQVLSSVAKLKEVMYTDGMYPINAADDNKGIKGFLVGRYPNDTWDGYESGSVGNPWILCTQALAELQYRAATEIMHEQEHKGLDHILVANETEQFFRGILLPRGYNGKVDAGRKVHAASTALALVEDADALLARVKFHIKGKNFRMYEQLNLDTGFEQGANDLTWSYGTLFGALAARKTAIESLQGSA